MRLASPLLASCGLLVGLAVPALAQPSAAPPTAAAAQLATAPPAAAPAAATASTTASPAMTPPSAVAPAAPAAAPHRKAGRVQLIGISDSRPQAPLRLAVGVNPPTRWRDDSFTASLLIGLSKRHALHLAGGSYKPQYQRDEDNSYEGSLKDLSVGVTYFPRKLWDGATFELGGLVRYNSLSTDTIDVSIDTATRRLGAQALVGWSWHLGGWAYVAVAIGGSVGKEEGEERRRTSTRGAGIVSVDRTELAVESYLRFGIAFDRQ